ncbi:putative ArsR family transcriptional regulator [Tetragenococcus halophilus subsp. halophilus]|uniref:Metalloregulator ArsR/SmtB family transcription factor n=2 Tax=Tetragenococcus halophilus TaxID=51669 RepID=A0AB35HNZ0_TETHA|nr:metalloregulator ArsR/SmtB family transcription factor [Tetragenococcus halophilus]MDN6270980.1 metalloregulator ArsR/SmtB family transcription factor [Tetragenococcus koreensis]AOF48524.1 ArsR family transcriptional regulator [Tetragenococcus halophilus]MCO8288625.1 winged helix-turn-helix transcriptional regulator [Tetragenococcus halophilus]MCO8292166.1 winged helix-turn-helix transcriptional regulator [Tetragenococcus halophilus]MCO8293170.1 winged helix-turn-helix transcriptional regul
MEKQDLQQLKTAFADTRDFLLALGDEKRQLIIMALLEQESCDGLRVVDLTEITQLSRPAVSHHLNILKQANIVSVRSEGTKNYYYFSNMIDNVKDMKKLIDQLLNLLEEKEVNQ